ncbi:DNA-binding protein HU-beta [Paraburkholderia aspalathi]|nr:DNA-binding protein HU-beta [Paraburkholderia aspalathi]
MRRASKTATGEVVDVLIDTVTTVMAGCGTVQLIGFGSFSSGGRTPRVGRSLATGKAIQILAAKTAKFTAGKMFREAVNAS